MKKLRLKALSLGAREILSREQLRSITGGCSGPDECLGGWCINGNCTSTNLGSGSSTGSGGRDGCVHEPCPDQYINNVLTCMTPQCSANGNFVGCVPCDMHI